MQIASLPRTTEAKLLAAKRIGQDIFRDRLMKYWQGRCPRTGITDPLLLRASHIIPWAERESDAERLDVHNGLLLSALWDTDFVRAPATFDDEAKPEFSSRLSEQARTELRWSSPIPLRMSIAGGSFAIASGRDLRRRTGPPRCQRIQPAPGLFRRELYRRGRRAELLEQGFFLGFRGFQMAYFHMAKAADFFRDRSERNGNCMIFGRKILQNFAH